MFATKAGDKREVAARDHEFGVEQLPDLPPGSVT
jgi:hypothetical protein